MNNFKYTKGGKVGCIASKYVLQKKMRIQSGLAEFAKEIAIAAQRGYLVQGIKKSIEELYEEIIISFENTHVKYDVVWEGIQKALEEDIEQNIIHKINQCGKAKDLLTNAVSIINDLYGERGEEVYHFILQNILPPSKKETLDYKEVYRQKRRRELLPVYAPVLDEFKLKQVHILMRFIEERYNCVIDFFEDTRRLYALNDKYDQDKTIQFILREEYKHIFADMLRAFELVSSHQMSNDIWEAAESILDHLPDEAITYKNIENKSHRWVINRIKDIVFATELVEQEQLNKQFKYLGEIRDAWCLYFVELLGLQHIE